MPYLFAYGTLQQSDVQRATFGRLLEGENDALLGFERSTSHGHLDVKPTGRSEDRVAGLVYEITDAELASADRYEERAEFARITGTVASGKQVWLYVYFGSRPELRRPRIDHQP